MSKSIEDLKDFMRAKGHVFTSDEQQQAGEKRAVNALLELSHQRPKDEPETDNPLVNQVLRQVRR